MIHHTKTIGDLGVLKAQVNLYEKGYIVSVPLTEHAPFDLVITKDGESKTVQVKSRKVDKTGGINIAFKNVYSDSKGTHVKYVDKTQIDLYCIYCPDTDECYYFNPSLYNKSINIRVNPPKNNAKSNINFAKDFKDIL